MSYVNVAIGVATVFTSISKGRQAKADAGAKAMADNYQADQEEQASQQQADIIRRAGAYAQARATAGYAASGVQVGSGSAEVVDNQIETDTAHDAFTAILNGTKRANQLRAGGTIAQAAGKAANDQAITSGALSAAQQIYGGYKQSGWSTKGAGG